ncbi:MAG: hypothetical protein WCW84_10080 [Sulfurimonas sp.]|jgi:hypothetical protein
MPKTDEVNALIVDDFLKYVKSLPAICEGVFIDNSDEISWIYLRFPISMSIVDFESASKRLRFKNHNFMVSIETRQIVFDTKLPEAKRGMPLTKVALAKFNKTVRTLATPISPNYSSWTWDEITYFGVRIKDSGRK